MAAKQLGRVRRRPRSHQAQLSPPAPQRQQAESVRSVSSSTATTLRSVCRASSPAAGTRPATAASPGPRPDLRTGQQQAASVPGVPRDYMYAGAERAGGSAGEELRLAAGRAGVSVHAAMVAAVAVSWCITDVQLVRGDRGVALVCCTNTNLFVQQRDGLTHDDRLRDRGRRAFRRT